jgi:hypothetical protein
MLPILLCWRKIQTYVQRRSLLQSCLYNVWQPCSWSGWTLLINSVHYWFITSMKISPRPPAAETTYMCQPCGGRTAPILRETRTVQIYTSNNSFITKPPLGNENVSTCVSAKFLWMIDHLCSAPILLFAAVVSRATNLLRGSLRRWLMSVIASD